MEHVTPPYESLTEKLASRRPITITVEYSCLDRQGPKEDMIALKGWHEKGIVQLQGTEAMIAEFEKANPGVREKLEEQYSFLSKLHPSFGSELGRMRLGRAQLGMTTTLRHGKDALDYYREFERLVFPNGCGRAQDVHDVEHISIHYLFGRDVFITRNTRHFRAEEMRERFADLIVLTPSQCVEVLRRSV